jgi:hypothetical protein
VEARKTVTRRLQCAGVQKTGRLAAGVALHMVYNAVVLFL